VKIEPTAAPGETWLVKALEALPEGDRETVERAVEISAGSAAADV